MSVSAPSGSVALPELRSAGLGVRPTPLDALPRLSGELGISLRAKRDDTLPLALGGNKVRKLDLILADAVTDGVDVVLTAGGIGSNHARLTAAAAARLGLRAVLYLNGERPEAARGNLLLDELLGADIRFVPNELDRHEAMLAGARELQASGARPLVIPSGGATPHGVAAYALAVRELAEDFGDEPGPDWIVVAAGTGSTLAGIALGVRLFLPETRVLGISVEPEDLALDRRVHGFIGAAEQLLGVPPLAREEYRYAVTHRFAGPDYAVPSQATLDAIARLARAEGLVTDPTYTGKAAHGLFELAEQGRLAGEVVFWHTGGAVGLFG